MNRKIIGRDISFLYRSKLRYGDREFRGFGLNCTQGEVLLYINNNLGTSLKGINNYFQFNKASITKIINHLEEKDLVYKDTNHLDKRESDVYLTENGIKLVPLLIEKFQKWEDISLNSIGKGQIEDLRDLLSKMVANVKELK